MDKCHFLSIIESSNKFNIGWLKTFFVWQPIHMMVLSYQNYKPELCRFRGLHRSKMCPSVSEKVYSKSIGPLKVVKHLKKNLKVFGKHDFFKNSNNFWLTLVNKMIFCKYINLFAPGVSYASAPDDPNLGKFPLWRRIAEDWGTVELIRMAQILARPNLYNILEVPISEK